MYERLPAFVLGFHGCSRETGEALLDNSLPMKKSAKDHDWLGHGMYFWENDPVRALEWARASKPSKHDPFVVGAVIDLGHCLNLLNYQMLGEVKNAHDALEATLDASEYAALQNTDGPDKLKRKKDCAVILALHELRAQGGLVPYDTVRSVFWEGEEIYADAGFKEKNHIQICVRDAKLIKGFFIPRY